MGGSALSDHSIQVQDSANRLNGLSNGWARPFNKADRLLEEKTTVFNVRLREQAVWSLVTNK